MITCEYKKRLPISLFPPWLGVITESKSVPEALNRLKVVKLPANNDLDSAEWPAVTLYNLHNAVQPSVMLLETIEISSIMSASVFSNSCSVALSTA